jgi:hypothetical protein
MYDLHDLLYNVQFQCSNLYSLEIKLMPAVGYCVSMYFLFSRCVFVTCTSFSLYMIMCARCIFSPWVEPFTAGIVTCSF